MRPDEVTEILRRPGSALLKVLVYASVVRPRLLLDTWYSQRASLALVFQEIHRFQLFELIFVQDYFNPMTGLLDYLLQQLKLPAPSLRKLLMDINAETIGEDRKIVRTLFSGTTPRLKHPHHRIITGF